jgi:hypothetical protein
LIDTCAISEADKMRVNSKCRAIAQLFEPLAGVNALPIKNPAAVLVRLLAEPLLACTAPST